MDIRRVPVFDGPRVRELADPARVRQLIRAPNVEVVRKRKTREVVQINLLSQGDDSAWQPEHPRGNPRRYSHDHENANNPHGVWTLRYLQREDRRLYRAALIECLKSAA